MTDPQNNAHEKDAIGTLAKALFQCLETQGWDAISLGDIATRANISLAQMRELVDSKPAILEKFAARIDAMVLEGIDADLADEPARERLFDILMARFDALAEHKPGLAALHANARRNPLLAAELNRIACRSQSWMLTGAGIETGGLMGTIRIQALVFAFLRVFETWLHDEDAGLASTMAELDRVLRQGDTHLTRLERLGTFASPLPDAAERLFRSMPKPRMPGFVQRAAQEGETQ